MKKNNIWNKKAIKWLVITVIVMGIFFIREDSILNLISNIKRGTVKEMKLEYVNRTKIEDSGLMEIYGDKILSWKENSLKILSHEGEILEKKNFDDENLEILYGEEKLYIINKDLGEIRSFNENGQLLGRLEIGQGLFNLKEENEKLLCHMKNEKEELIIFNSQGEEIIRNTDLIDVLTYSTDEDASKYLISTMKLEDFMESQLDIYSNEGKILNTYEFPGEIVVWTEFLKGRQIVLTNLNLYIYNKGEIQLKKPFPFIKDIEIVDENIYVLYNSSLEIIDLNGEIQEKLTLSKEYRKIFVYEDSGILYGNRDILGVKKGIEIFNYTVDEDIDSIYKTGELIGIGYKDRIDLFKLKEK